MNFAERKAAEYQAKLDAKADEKRRKWQEIKQKAPDLADFLLAAKAVGLAPKQPDNLKFFN